jgi:hypothetical protein
MRQVAQPRLSQTPNLSRGVAVAGGMATQAWA